MTTVNVSVFKSPTIIEDSDILTEVNEPADKRGEAKISVVF